MPPFAIALRNLRTHRLPTMLTTLIVAFGVALAVAVVALGAGVRRGLATAGGPFELVIGPKGSATQLVTSSVLFQDVPIGNISYSHFEALAQDSRVRDAVPIALGDNLGGLRIVGTAPALFGVAVTPDRPPFYRLAQGQVFAQDFEAVLGNAAARRLGLELGATFESAHGTLAGVNETAHEGFDYTVVGVLAPTGTPVDLGIYVPLSSYWKVHGDMRDSIFTPGETANSSGTTASTAHSGVTAVLVRGRDVSATYQLYNELNNGNDLQAALPGAVLTQLLDLLGQGQRLLTSVSVVALAMAMLSVLLSLYGALLLRRRQIAVMRALGAHRWVIVRVTLYEALFQAAVGVLVGLVLGHTLTAIIAYAINQRSALAVAATGEPLAEVLMSAGLLLLGVLAGVLPAIQAYRVDPATALGGGG